MNTSPFKFLNSYEKEDKDLFFGREEETEALYKMTYDTRLILLYGGSGTGKTSLLQAGLANKFSETRWKDILIRRNDNINDSLRDSVRHELEQAGGKWPKEGLEIMEAIRQIQQLSFLPIYLIFDQFEELFILEKDAEEQQMFFDFIQQLLTASISCKVILSLREEFLADLWVFEKEVPTLFDHRFRVERMRMGQLEKVVSGTLNTLVLRGQLTVEEPTVVVGTILDRLNVENTGVELTYLQVYLDRLYQLASAESKTDIAIFNPALVNQLGTVEDVIGDFLDDQLHALGHGTDEHENGLAIQLLGSLVSDEQTKKVLHIKELQAFSENLQMPPAELNRYLQAFEGMRIIKRYTVKDDLKVELTHDVIAKKVWERLPEANKQLRQIKKSLEQRQQDFLEEKGSLLGEKELNAWAYYFPKLQLEENIQQYIEDSKATIELERRREAERLEREKAQIEKNRKLQKRIGRGLILLGSIIGLLLILTLYARVRLNTAQTKNIEFLLSESQAQVKGLQYEVAQGLLSTAYDLKKNNPAVGEGMMEIAYFFNEAGQLEKALSMADTLSKIFEQSLDVGLADQSSLRQYLKKLDDHYFQVLESRYYPQLKAIPGGTFTMGCDTTQSGECGSLERPAFQTKVDDFQMAMTETTVWQYHLYLQASGKDLPNKPSWGWSGDYPMSDITWPQAIAYCNWLNTLPSQQGPNDFRLPSETEWEFAAREGIKNSHFLYSGSDLIDSIAWYYDNSESPQPVRTKSPNALGIYDLSGNVWEWCSNLFAPYPLGRMSQDAAASTNRLLRGGSYDSDPEDTKVYIRLQMNPEPPFEETPYGFRVARN